MNPVIGDLLSRLANDSVYADRYFADPATSLDELEIPQADRSALMNLDRDAVDYLSVAPSLEPGLAPEHPSNNTGNRWMTLVIGLWGCIAFVVFWLLTGKSL